MDFSEQLYVQVERKKADGTYVVIGTRDKFSVVPYAMWSDTFDVPLLITGTTDATPFVRIINTFGPAISGESQAGGRGINGVSNTGRGVYGSSKSDVGVYGTSVSGYGVYGINSDTGHFGHLGGPNYGAFGAFTLASGIYGALGTNGAGVYGQGSGAAYSGYFSGGAGVVVEGNLTVTGTKNFTQPHPHDPTKEIVYVAMEAPESVVMIRGTARLIDGRAVIETPDYFRMVASTEGITVQFTPRSAISKGLAAVEVNRERVIVAELLDGKGTYEFDYFITAKRAGFENHQPVQPNTHFSADMKKKEEFEAQFKGDDMGKTHIRKLLISNGILTEDGKLNMETVKRLGWILKDAEVAEIR